VTTEERATSDAAEIACTLDSSSTTERIEAWQQLLDDVTDRSAIEGGLRLELDGEVPLEAVVRLAHAEHACCRFLSFGLTIDDRGVGLEVRAAPDAMPVVLALFGAPS
jgi:hypothetical protein